MNLLTIASNYHTIPTSSSCSQKDHCDKSTVALLNLCLFSCAPALSSREDVFTVLLNQHLRCFCAALAALAALYTTENKILKQAQVEFVCLFLSLIVKSKKWEFSSVSRLSLHQTYSNVWRMIPLPKCVDISLRHTWFIRCGSSGCKQMVKTIWYRQKIWTRHEDLLCKCSLRCFTFRTNKSSQGANWIDIWICHWFYTIIFKQRVKKLQCLSNTDKLVSLNKALLWFRGL